MTKKRCLYAGTFDPITNGHDDVVQRALKAFDEVVVLVAKSPTKNPLFSAEEREEIIRELYKDEDRVLVDSWGGLIVEYAKNHDIGIIVRGLRPTGDFDVEFQMAAMNNKINPDVNTVFFTTDANNFCISSSLVKEIYKHGGNISEMVPRVVQRKLEEKWKSLKN